MFEQLRELRDRHGYEVAAVVLAHEGKLIDKLRSGNIRYHVVHFATGAASIRSIIRLPFSVLSLAWLFRKERFDIVQSHVFATTITARPAAWIADVPVRLAMIASPFHLQARLSRHLEHATSFMETMLIPTCELTLTLCRQLGIPPTRLAPVIYYGPDEKRFDPKEFEATNLRQEFGWPEDTPIITCVAYFYHRMPKSGWMPRAVHGRGHKGHEDLVRAVPRVLEEFPNAKFLLVGSGWGTNGESYLEEIKSMVRDLGLEDSVIFMGYRADANRILSDSNVAVQAALNENLGGTIEALLMECPTVATRVGGMVDAVRDGETGVPVNPSDSDDLARGILRLLRDPKTAKSLARAGRARMLSRFTLKHTVEDLNHLYEELMLREAGEHFRLSVSVARLIAGVPIFLCVVFKTFLMKLDLRDASPRPRTKTQALTEMHESISN
ncbi:MAG TPA: glycosyltransferase family 4 protein [Pyrinomonadaceae bacterium]|jgi:glycosyltransferase involved in cell wall biosynthesis|nr:glycosyltransferase family 4 protein [Pyrinomonadaceae bacterium]